MTPVAAPLPESLSEFSDEELSVLGESDLEELSREVNQGDHTQGGISVSKEGEGPVPGKPFRFQDLPAEIRLCVYQIVVLNNHNISFIQSHLILNKVRTFYWKVQAQSKKHARSPALEWNTNPIRFGTPKLAQVPVELNLFHVNKLVSNEARGAHKSPSQSR